MRKKTPNSVTCVTVCDFFLCPTDFFVWQFVLLSLSKFTQIIFFSSHNSLPELSLVISFTCAPHIHFDLKKIAFGWDTKKTKTMMTMKINLCKSKFSWESRTERSTGLIRMYFCIEHWTSMRIHIFLCVCVKQSHLSKKQIKWSC